MRRDSHKIKHIQPFKHFSDLFKLITSMLLTMEPRRVSSLIKYGAKNFETEHTSKFDKKYEMVEKLGEGNFGEVFCAKSKGSENERAVKILAKSLIDDEEILAIENEIKILRSVDHPNILKLYEVFENEETYQIVTDMMRGGSLADDLEGKGTEERFGTLTETDAAILMRQLLSCINYCHQNKIVHRDVKTENIMLESNKALDRMKVIDFGLSKFFYDENPRFIDMYGTPDYMAPQVFNEDYGPKCDIWSCGVVLFEVLSGLMPFSDLCSERNDMVTQDNIMNEDYSFEDPIWNSISDSAKDFVEHLLTYEEKDRPTAEKALGHPFLKEAKIRSVTMIDTMVAQRAMTALEAFGIDESLLLAYAANAYIAAQLLTKEETEEIDELFRAMDIDGDGILTKDEIKASYQDILGRSLSDDEVEAMFDRVDADANGTIGYSEFVVATLNSDILHSGDKLRTTFNRADTDGSGAISKTELNGLLSLFETTLNEEELDDMMKRADVDGDGEISYDEFVALVTSSFLKRENSPEIIEEDGYAKDVSKKIMLMSALQDSFRSFEGSNIDKELVPKKTNPILAMFEKTIAENTEKGVDSNPHRARIHQIKKTKRAPSRRHMRNSSVESISIGVLMSALHDSFRSFDESFTIDEEEASKKTDPILAMFEKTIAENTEKGVDSNPHRSIHQMKKTKRAPSRRHMRNSSVESISIGMLMSALQDSFRSVEGSFTIDEEVVPKKTSKTIAKNTKKREPRRGVTRNSSGEGSFSIGGPFWPTGAKQLQVA
jgi:calcium-dependent protein kinase